MQHFSVAPGARVRLESARLFAFRLGLCFPGAKEVSTESPVLWVASEAQLGLDGVFVVWWKHHKVHVDIANKHK